MQAVCFHSHDNSQVQSEDCTAVCAHMCASKRHACVCACVYVCGVVSVQEEEEEGRCNFSSS